MQPAGQYSVKIWKLNFNTARYKVIHTTEQRVRFGGHIQARTVMSAVNDRHASQRLRLRNRKHPRISNFTVAMDVITNLDQPREIREGNNDHVYHHNFGPEALDD